MQLHSVGSKLTTEGGDNGVQNHFMLKRTARYYVWQTSRDLPKPLAGAGAGDLVLEPSRTALLFPHCSEKFNNVIEHTLVNGNFMGIATAMRSCGH